MADYVKDVQELYVAYFSRPADTTGLAFWTGQMQTNPNVYQDMAAAFSTSAEYRTAYANMDTRETVLEIYDNLFGRTADATGLAFWTNALDTGKITIDDMVTQVAAGAQGTDQFAFNAKVAVATEFTSRLDTPQEQAAYSGNAANLIAIQYIAAIKDTTSAAMARDPGNIDATIARIVAGPTALEEVGLVGVADPGGVFV